MFLVTEESWEMGPGAVDAGAVDAGARKSFYRTLGLVTNQNRGFGNTVV